MSRARVMGEVQKVTRAESHGRLATGKTRVIFPPLACRWSFGLDPTTFHIADVLLVMRVRPPLYGRWEHGALCMVDGNMLQLPLPPVGNVAKAVSEQPVRPREPGQLLRRRKAKEKVLLDVSLDGKQLVF